MKLNTECKSCLTIDRCKNDIYNDNDNDSDNENDIEQS